MCRGRYGCIEEVFVPMCGEVGGERTVGVDVRGMCLAAFGETWVWSAPSGGLCPASARAIWTKGPGMRGSGHVEQGERRVGGGRVDAQRQRCGYKVVVERGIGESEMFITVVPEEAGARG